MHDAFHNGPHTAETRFEIAQREVDDLIDSLPDDVRQHALDVNLELDAAPSPALLRKGIPRSLLGLFRGFPLRGPQGRGIEETTIYLFLDNLWSYAGRDLRSFRREVRRTYLHELGHYLGLNEQELRQREL